jgi:hypothetical protein
MLERKKGAIVNVGSLEGNIPAPFYTIYGATKAFVEVSPFLIFFHFCLVFASNIPVTHPTLLASHVAY